MEEQRALLAARDGDLATLEQLLEAGTLGAELCWLVREGGCGLQDQDDSGVSPLHLAARFAHPVLVEWLLREGHAATLETLEGALPLHHAAVSGDLTCLKLLAAAHRSSVNRRTRSGASPLYLACQEGHLHLAQFLVKDCGADVHLRALDGMSALHAAAARGHYSLVVWLVTFTDIGLTARDNEGATALHFAARGGHTPILDRLLLLGAPIMRDSWGGTPLHDAAENGQMECCQTLVSHRVDPSLRDEDGYTAADLAEYHGHQDCAQYLRETARPVPLLMTPPPPPFPPPPLSAARRSPEDGRGGSGLRSPTSASLSPAWPGQSDQPLPREQMTHAAALGISTSALVVTTGAETAAGDTPQGLAALQLDGLPSGDLDGLVPTRDERGRPKPTSFLAEQTPTFFEGEGWAPTGLGYCPALPSLSPGKSQLVSRAGLPGALGAGHLGELEPAGRSMPSQHPLTGPPCAQEDGGSVGPTEQAAWRYSQTHQAILGPFGELLTEDDLVYLEKQIADLQLRRRCQEYESQLGQLAAELQALLPEPLVSITVNSHFLPRAPGLEGEEAPCPVPEPSGPEVAVEAVQGGQPLPFWCSHVARLVRSMSLLLKGMNGLVQGEEKPAVQPPQEASREAPASPPQSEAQREIQECGVSVRTLRGNFESAPCLPCIPNLGPCEAGAPPGQCPRAYWPAPPQPRGSPIGGEPGPGDTEEASDSGISCEEAPSEAGAGHSPDLANLRKERIVMLFLSHWKKWPRAQGLLSPEQFLPHVDGAPVPYGSLTLDLFMLGYFQLLECDLPAEERKMRHLLCFEVFEHLGAHGWEAARAFHKAVTDEVASGRRAWTDGFEDIKARFFGSNRGPAWDAEPGRKSGLTPLGPPPHTSSPSGGPEPAAQRLGSSSQRGSFNSEDICGYIDRSFAFWKEKEAEMFSFGD
ncbi:PREDICTED: LOW QUALITY PROTEIN: espin-like protein [Myotis davidii]|uniref:LOW QUALITY PROTEIN: espin-like protein n=1 Tax=Myotis davidii TaxID=225400 RepID=UPI00076785B0|nr:PREDICTED: LOW QUALITY PROTEIN: espin-like protein [Myotis davidii]